MMNIPLLLWDVVVFFIHLIVGIDDHSTSCLGYEASLKWRRESNAYYFRHKWMLEVQSLVEASEEESASIPTHGMKHHSVELSCEDGQQDGLKEPLGICSRVWFWVLTEFNSSISCASACACAFLLPLLDYGKMLFVSIQRTDKSISPFPVTRKEERRKIIKEWGVDISEEECNSEGREK
jgi:hypothetical protein